MDSDLHGHSFQDRRLFTGYRWKYSWWNSDHHWISSFRNSGNHSLWTDTYCAADYYIDWHYCAHYIIHKNLGWLMTYQEADNYNFCLYVIFPDPNNVLFNHFYNVLSAY